MSRKSTPKTMCQIKLEKAHQRNLYLKKIKEMMGIIGCESAFKLLNPLELDILYNVRLRPIKLKCSEDMCVTIVNKELKKINTIVNRLLIEKTISLGQGIKPISLYDFFTYIESIYLLWRNAKVEQFKQKFPLFTNGYQELRVDLLEEINGIIQNLSWMFCDVLHRLVWMEKETLVTKHAMDLSPFQNIYLIHTEKPEALSLEIDGITRVVYRLGFSFEGIKWVTIPPEKLGKRGSFNMLPLKVYIQSHVIERMKERLGSYFSVIFYIQIMTAILTKKALPAEENNFLFPVEFSSIKLGYLRTTIIGDKLVVRTFLFLTNNGTPEGRRLNELMGLQKEDKKFLAIDTLNAFLKSDIIYNQNLKTLFSKAGCGKLFEIRQHMGGEIVTSVHCADFLSKYLGIAEKSEVS